MVSKTKLETFNSDVRPVTMRTPVFKVLLDVKYNCRGGTSDAVTNKLEIELHSIIRPRKYIASYITLSTFMINAHFQLAILAFDRIINYVKGVKLVHIVIRIVYGRGLCKRFMQPRKTF